MPPSRTGSGCARSAWRSNRWRAHASLRDPHSPWRRGGIENANGLLRRDPRLRGDRLCRRTNPADHTDDDIDDVIRNLNATPRKRLAYRTPIEAFAANLGVAREMRIQRTTSAPETTDPASRPAGPLSQAAINSPERTAGPWISSSKPTAPPKHADQDTRAVAGRSDAPHARAREISGFLVQM